jgi:hypothetical protein
VFRGYRELWKVGDGLMSTGKRRKLGTHHIGVATVSQSLPGKRGFPLSISASTQPTLQISIARVYSLKVSMTSGARYHLDTALAVHMMRRYDVPSGNIFRQEVATVVDIWRWAGRPCEAKVTELERINKEIRVALWSYLEIAVRVQE